MAAIKDSVPVTGLLAPTDDTDVFPVTDPKYQVGGWRECESLDEMNNIPEPRRREGMVCSILEGAEFKYYQYKNGMFTSFKLGGGDTGGGGGYVNLSNYYSKFEVDTLIDELGDTFPDITNYYTKGETYNQTEIKDYIATSIRNIPSVDLSPYYRKDELYTQDEVNTKLRDIKDQIVEVPTVDNTTVKLRDTNELYIEEASQNDYGVIKVDNVDTWLENGVLKVAKTNPDNTTLIKNSSGELQINPNIITNLTETKRKLEDLLLTGIPEDVVVEIPIADEVTFGKVKPDNDTIVINNGVISTKKTVTPDASKTEKGLVKADETTLTVTGGVMSILNKIDRLTQLKDVNLITLKGQVGKVLAVNNGEDGFELKNVNAPTAKYTEIEINNPTYVFGVDLNPYYNIAANAMVKVLKIGTDTCMVKYVSKSGAEYEEEVMPAVQRLIPMNELDMSIYVSGHAKLMVSITSYK